MKVRARNQSYLTQVAASFQVPSELLMGIYVLETTYRKWYHRILENVLTIMSILLNFIFKRRVKNYTIGPFQVGLATLLTNAGHPRYRHCLQLEKIDMKEFKIILEGMTFRGSAKACAQHLEKVYLREVVRSKDIDEGLSH